MSDSNCCFLAYLKVSQETGKVVWYSHLLKTFPAVCCDPHTVKGCSIVSEADVFLAVPCFLYDPTMLAIWSLVPLPFLNPACISVSSQFTNCKNLAWRILCPEASGILVLCPGIKPMSPALKGKFLITGPPGKSFPDVLRDQAGGLDVTFTQPSRSSGPRKG